MWCVSLTYCYTVFKVALLGLQGCSKDLIFLLVWISQAFFTFVRFLYCLLMFDAFADIHLDDHKTCYLYRVTIMNATIHFVNLLN